MLIYCICTQYLVGAPFALITASIRHGMEVISGTAGVAWKPRFLWQWPSAHLHFLVSCFSFSSWQYPNRFSMGFRSGEFAGQSSTPTPWSFNQLLVLLAGAKSCWKMKWMNEWCIYIALFCVLLYTQSALQSCGGLSPQPPPVCSIHLDDATAATGQRRQCAHHTPATGGEERES